MATSRCGAKMVTTARARVIHSIRVMMSLQSSTETFCVRHQSQTTKQTEKTSEIEQNLPMNEILRNITKYLSFQK